MKRLHFEKRKYGKELLIDAANEQDLEFVDDVMSLSFYCLAFLKRASGSYQLDLYRFELADQLVLFIRPSQINVVSGAQFDECTLLFFEGGFLDEFFVDRNFIFKFGCFHSIGPPPYLTLDASTFRKYYELAGEIKSEIGSLTADSHHILRSLIYYLLMRLDQRYAGQYGLVRNPAVEAKFLEFQKLLFSSIRRIKQVEEYANELNISRVHLNKLCQRYLSKTATQVIREHLITEIKKELKYSEKDFAEIAYEFNFSAPSNFSRFVKQMTGLSPQEHLAGLSN